MGNQAHLPLTDEARTQVLELQASERRILVQMYCLQSETWEQADESGNKNPWLLGEMSENRFPDARGREEG